MISLLGVLSLAVLVISAAALLLHFKVLRLRGALDDSLDALDGILRDRLDILYETAGPDGQELRALCESCSSCDTRRLIKALPKLEKMAEDFKEEDDFDTAEALEENAAGIEAAVEAYNSALAAYNAYVGAFPGRIMAYIVGLGQEKRIALPETL